MRNQNAKHSIFYLETDKIFVAVSFLSNLCSLRIRAHTATNKWHNF